MYAHPARRPGLPEGELWRQVRPHVGQRDGLLSLSLLLLLLLSLSLLSVVVVVVVVVVRLVLEVISVV